MNVFYDGRWIGRDRTFRSTFVVVVVSLGKKLIRGQSFGCLDHWRLISSWWAPLSWELTRGVWHREWGKTMYWARHIVYTRASRSLVLSSPVERGRRVLWVPSCPPDQLPHPSVLPGLRVWPHDRWVRRHPRCHTLHGSFADGGAATDSLGW